MDQCRSYIVTTRGITQGEATMARVLPPVNTRYMHSIIRTVVFPCHPHAMLDATVSSAALYLPRLGGRTTQWEFDTATVTTTRRTAAATVAATRSGRICSGQTERRSRLRRVNKRHP